MRTRAAARQDAAAGVLRALAFTQYACCMHWPAAADAAAATTSAAAAAEAALRVCLQQPGFLAPDGDLLARLLCTSRCAAAVHLECTSAAVHLEALRS